MTKITGRFSWKIPEVYTSFVHGADAMAIYNSLNGSMTSGISYDKQSQTLMGSDVFAAARIDSILRITLPVGIRVANKVFKMKTLLKRNLAKTTVLK